MGNLPLDAAQFEAVLDSISDAVFTVGRDFTITSFNRSAERLTGYRRNEVIGRCCYEVFRTVGCRTTNRCPMVLSLRTGGITSTRELEIRDRQGQTRHVRLSFNPLRDGDGRVVGGVESIQTLSNGTGAAASDGRPILAATERRVIEDVLHRHHGNKTAASRELGISRITLWRKMRKLSINDGDSRSRQA